MAASRHSRQEEEKGRLPPMTESVRHAAQRHAKTCILPEMEALFSGEKTARAGVATKNRVVNYL